MDLHASTAGLVGCSKFLFQPVICIASEAPNIPPPMATQFKEVDAELVRHYSAVNELLRHFWACFPTRTPLLEQKVRDHHGCVLYFKSIDL